MLCVLLEMIEGSFIPSLPRLQINMPPFNSTFTYDFVIVPRDKMKSYIATHSSPSETSKRLLELLPTSLPIIELTDERHTQERVSIRVERRVSRCLGEEHFQGLTLSREVLVSGVGEIVQYVLIGGRSGDA